MSHGVVTALIVLVALALYLIGFSAGAYALIGLGLAFEVWFWVRLMQGSKAEPPKPAP